MKASVITFAAIFAAAPLAVSAQTASPVPTAEPAELVYTTSDTELGTLLDDPAARAVLMKHIPEVVGNEQIEQARSMTLLAIQPYSGDALSDEVLEKIDVDLASLSKAE